MATRGQNNDKATAPQTGVDAGRAAFEHEKPPERTPGLKLFDAFLYPGITNVGVFGISVVATYLTSKGGMKNAQGELIYGKFGDWMQKRGDVLMNWMKSKGLSHDTAEMAKYVAFSFGDGTLLAPVVKKFEDNREDIAKSIDNALGTRPDTDDAYKAEPKQTWGSVLGGRAITALIVIPTAVMLDKKGLNNVMFSEPGKRLGEWMNKTPFIKRNAGHVDLAELGKISVFEAFYTSICTAGLYISSRFLAGWGEDKSQPKPSDEIKPAATIRHSKAPSANAPKPFMPAAPVALKSEPKTDEPKAELPKPKDSKPVVVESPIKDTPTVKVDAANLSHEPSRVHSHAETTQHAGMNG